MALSTLEFVTDIPSESSMEGQFGATPVSAPVLRAGSETSQVEARPARSPDIVRRILFLIECGEWHHNLMWQSEDVFLKRKPYLFDEGSDVLSFAFRFKDMVSAGAVLLGDASGARYGVERLPFGTQNSVVGEPW